MSARFFHRLVCVAVAFGALLATSFVYHSLLPPAIPEGVTEKLRFFAKREWQRWTDPWKLARPWMRWLGWALTMYWFYFALMVFRALNLPDALVAARSFALFRSGGAQDLGAWMLWIVVALGIVHWMNARGTFAHWWRRGPDLAFAAAYGCTAGTVLLFIPPHYTPFIYFQF